MLKADHAYDRGKVLAERHRAPFLVSGHAFIESLFLQYLSLKELNVQGWGSGALVLFGKHPGMVRHI